MGVNVNDDLQRLFPSWYIGPSNRRGLIWLWLTLHTSGLSRTLGPFDGGGVRDKMAAHIKENDLRSTIDSWRNNLLIDDQLFTWIEDTGRQPTWLFNYVRATDNTAHNYPANLTSKERLVALIDCQSTSKLEKENLLWLARAAWVQRQKEDSRLAWYASSGKEKLKCEIAWHWYQEHHPQTAQYASKFAKLADILDFHDQTAFRLEEKLHHLEQIKKKFKAQQAAANRKGKRQTNMTLSDAARTMLDELAEKERSTKTEIVEFLILHAHVHGMPS